MEGGSMRFRMLLSESSLISRRDPPWAYRPHALRPLQMQVSWSRLVLLGIVGPIFPVQHHSPGAGTIGLSGVPAWRGPKVGVAGVNQATGSVGPSSPHDRLGWLGLAVMTWVRSEAALYKLSVSPGQAPSPAEPLENDSPPRAAHSDSLARPPGDKPTLWLYSENGLPSTMVLFPQGK